MTEPGTALRYKIIVQGRIDGSWSEWLNRMSIRYDLGSDGLPLTILTGPVADQSALRGLLSKIWNLNLSVVALQRVENGA